MFKEVPKRHPSTYLEEAKDALHAKKRGGICRKRLKQIAGGLAKLVSMPHPGRSKHGTAGCRMGNGVDDISAEAPAPREVQIGSDNRLISHALVSTAKARQSCCDCAQHSPEGNGNDGQARKR